MKAPALHEVTIVTPRSLALLDEHLANPGVPDVHARRFKVQTDGEGVYLAAWQDGAPVGYVLLYFKHPPHHASYERYPNHAYIEALDVRSKSRRQGFALALMENAEFRARSSGASHLGLSVGLGNAPARALYRKLGYQPADIPDYPVSWTYLDPATGEPKEEGEMCGFWVKPLV
jgi:ribosomal protein S18 acetylase RimI-like enzyme